MQILQHYNPNRPLLVKTDSSNFAIAAILSQKFEDGILRPVSFIFRKLSSGNLNYDVFDKEMLAMVFSITKWRYFLQGAEYKRIFYYNHHNRTYFMTAVSVN